MAEAKPPIAKPPDVKPPSILPRPPKPVRPPDYDPKPGLRKIAKLKLVERRDDVTDTLLSIVERFHEYYPVETPVNPELSEAWDDADQLLEEITDLQNRRETLGKITPAPKA